MILAAISDAHRSQRNLKRLLDALPRVDMLCFLGDCTADGVFLREGLRQTQPRAAYYGVAGNNDFGSDAPQEVLLPLTGMRILLTHGHRYNVKYTLQRLTTRAREAEVCAALYGHTHVPQAEYAHGILLLNPGALCDGRYALLEITGQSIMPKMMKLP